MKTTLLSCLAMAGSLMLSAQTNGPNNGNQFTTTAISGYSQTWTNTGNVQASDNTYASFGNLSAPPGSYSDYLVATDFGFDVPDGVNIFGIKVEIERSDPNGKTADYSIRIIRAGLLGAEDKSTGGAYPLTDSYQVYGSASDLWGEDWSYKDIENNNFGIAIAAQRNSGGGTTAGRIDDIRITVYYGFLTLPVTLVSFQALKADKAVQVGWKTASELNMHKYTVERSGEGRIFYPLQTINPLNQPDAQYTYLDEHPVAGTSYYRLKMEDLAGTTRYSNIIPVHFNKYTTAGLSPSPWVKGTELSISNPGNETLTIRFFNAGGKLVGQATTNNQQVPMPVLSDTRGLIYYRVTGGNNQLKGSGTLLVY